MANEILAKFSSSAALTITLASLASSTTGVGRQSDIVDNTTNRFQKLKIFVKITQGTSPTGNRAVYIYLIEDDNNATNHRSDGAVAADAAITVLNARLIGIGVNKASPVTGEIIYKEITVYDPPPKWAIAIVQDTGAALNATPGNHWIRYIGINPEVQ